MPAIPVRVQDEIIRAGRRMDRHGWVPATAGNISARFGRSPAGDPDHAAARIAITRSGCHKGALDSFAVMEVDEDGNAVTPDARPSAETLLHCQIYRRFPAVGAILHGHSVAGTTLSLHAAGGIRFSGYELFKAFPGQPTHDATLVLPIFDNDQDIARLARVIAPHLDACPLGYYIRGHGVYVWAADMEEALACLEAVEFLLSCELARRSLKQTPWETAG